MHLYCISLYIYIYIFIFLLPPLSSNTWNAAPGFEWHDQFPHLVPPRDPSCRRLPPAQNDTCEVQEIYIFYMYRHRERGRERQRKRYLLFNMVYIIMKFQSYQQIRESSCNSQTISDPTAAVQETTIYKFGLREVLAKFIQGLYSVDDSSGGMSCQVSDM